MDSKVPVSLQLLTDASDEPARDAAWTAFLEQYSKLILHVARSMNGGHDTVMDRYLFVIDALKRNDFKRLRSYSDSGRGTFTTWLVAVSRRLCVDEHRTRYGRSSAGQASPEQRDRRTLADLLSADGVLDTLEFPGNTPETDVESAEIREALERALTRIDVSDRLLLKLRYEDELSVPEIARLLRENSPFRIYRRIDGILAVLRKELALAGIGGVS
jgi:RNA polymerase sigma factor (sigma-70 family)